MAFIKYNNIGIKAITACVPQRIVSNYDLDYMIPKDNLEKLVKSIGIKQKRFAEEKTCTSDLCYKAAEHLFKENGIDRNSIDMLIFLSLTPDYRTPPTSVILQKKLGLRNTVGCFDMSLACSGFVYALSTAYAYASTNGVNRVLVLVGETMSKLVNSNDKVNYPLYGDAGTACIVEKGEFGESFFQLASDGSGENFVKIPAGGFRNPLTVESLLPKEKEENNIRRDVDITMDGLETFNHAVSAIPRQIKFLLLEAGINKDEIDYFVSHQANRFMIDFIMKRLKIDMAKVPYCLEKYGNTSCASIPLTISSELFDKLDTKKKLLLCSIGAGWSFGTAYIRTNNIHVSPVIEF